MFNEVRAVPKPGMKKKTIRQKKRKKLEVYKGVKVPPKRVRGQIKKENYELAMEHYGYACAESGRTDNIEMHHIVFRSQGGRGGWRNLVPLTREFHQLCHSKREYADKWKTIHTEKFGPYYSMDKFDLFKKGLIPNATDEAYERFMDRDMP